MWKLRHLPELIGQVFEPQGRDKKRLFHPTNQRLNQVSGREHLKLAQTCSRYQKETRKRSQ